MRNVGEPVSRRVLPHVERPSQYIGRETNARCPDCAAAEVTVALAFPEPYALGVSHYGSRILYHVLNDLPGVACDRAYCPLPDAEDLLRRRGLPLFGWESRCALGDFDILGFSLAYELCATNVLTMLDLAGVPLRADDRTEGHPIVVGGDALADTPEVLADFFDLFLVGDGEEVLVDLVEIVRRAKRSSARRADVILAAARTIPAAYAPRFHRPQYNADGTFRCLRRTRDDVPEQVRHACLKRLADSPPVRRPLVPLAQAVHDRVVVEIMRGCPNACRFCQAGSVRLPVRWRTVDEIVHAAGEALAATGYREISLLSLSTSDYPHLDELIDRLNARFGPRHVSISLPSLRVDSQLAHLPRLTSSVRKGGLTIAVEAASQRLRRAIRKDITDEHVLAGVRAAYQAGWRSVKVYFIAGLPGETDADVDAVWHLCRTLADTRRQVDGHPGGISASVSWFVPKPHTPMQWAPMRTADYFWTVRDRLRALARRSTVNFRFHRIEQSLLEAVLCRGDRRVGAAVQAAWRNGARLDAWHEHFDNDRWLRAFDCTGVDPAFYAHRPIGADERTPWAHVVCHRSTDFLRREYERMLLELHPGADPGG